MRESGLGPNDNKPALLTYDCTWVKMGPARSGSLICLAVAKGLKLDLSYVGRMLRLTSLARDIVEAIVLGKELEGISLRQLHDGVPLFWQEQRMR